MSTPISSKTLPVVNIQRDYYTMASMDGEDAEIQMYGEIVMERPVDFETGEPIDGMYIALNEFLEDLKLLTNAKRLTIRMNSCGGNAYAAMPIHNRLRELKAEKIAIIDGVAMSGGSLIVCACDKVIANPSSLFMMHKCWCCVFGSYNADELRKVAAGNDATDKAQAAIYKRKSGIDEDEILRMMSEETYLTGSEALEKGFVDELTEEEPVEIAASADRHTLFVNGRANKMSYALEKLPANIPVVKTATAKPAADMANKQPAMTGSNEGGIKPMAKTVEELRKEYPELTAQVEADARAAVVPPDNAAAVNAAVEAERKRQQEIDEIAPNILDADMVREAKYGDKPCTAQELAFNAMKQQSKKGAEHLDNTAKDFKASGAEGVPPAAPPQDGGEPETKESVEAQAKADAEAYNKRKGVS